MSIRVRVYDEEIVVTDPKTEWRVCYRHSSGMNGLVATQVVTDRKASSLERSRFMAAAFRAAAERARKLGWKV
jgi:hypothetical protein